MDILGIMLAEKENEVDPREVSTYAGLAFLELQKLLGADHPELSECIEKAFLMPRHARCFLFLFMLDKSEALRAFVCDAAHPHRAESRAAPSPEKQTLFFAHLRLVLDRCLSFQLTDVEAVEMLRALYVSGKTPEPPPQTRKKARTKRRVLS